MLALVYHLETKQLLALADRSTKEACDRAIQEAGYNEPTAYGIIYNPSIETVDGLIPNTDAETL